MVHLVGQFGDAFLTGMAALDRDLADAGAVSSRRSDERGGNAQPSSAPPLTADISQDSGHVRLVPESELTLIWIDLDQYQGRSAWLTRNHGNCARVDY